MNDTLLTIDAALEDLMPSQGFERSRPGRWVRSTKQPVREVFEFQAMKGMVRSARWGFSLDFVPVLQGTRLKWKRTLKSLAFDLCIDPIDRAGSLLAWFTVSQSDPERVVRRVVRQTVGEAASDFDQVDSVADVIRVFDDRNAMSFVRFSLENYVQTHIAWGLALISVGKPAEGEEHLRRFRERFGVDADNALLTLAVAQASHFNRLQ
jgi:hypothetical protein